MRKNIFTTVLLSSMVVPAYANISDSISINGFGSVIGASVVDGDGYIAEYPNLAIYEDSDLDFGQETRLGIQITGRINEKMSATTQLLMRGANDFDTEIGWAYFTYDITDTSAVQIGRMRVPVYHFSEFMDVGYAYPWVRIPSDTYSLDVTNYNGIRYLKSFSISDYTLDLTFLYGQEKNDDVELMSYLFPDQIDRDFEDLLGVVVNFDMNNFVIRSSYVEGEMFETRHLPAWLAPIVGLNNTYPSSTGKVDSNGDLLVAADTEYDISFFDVSVKASLGDFSFFAEYNKYKPFYKSYFASIDYRWDEFQAYLLYSKFDLDQPWESHDTTAIGLRYDFMTNVAFKVEISKFDDTGYNPFTLEPNPVFKGDPDGDGDVTVVTFGFDFVF
ncbi:porin [Flocculibacter collagenilyticus]|uniref:porin n=1 Tax=Flocculibacter collagenilyticus TaxID=2744479 RepID=UPI0018F3F3EE|nr:porin [Flocculibacter collagenilyticus]